MKILLMLFIGIAPLLSFAEIITIPTGGNEIPTAYWPKEKSKAVLIFLPGGEGSFNIASKNPPKPIWMLSTLYDSNLSPDIVFLDSNVCLGWNTLGPRYTKEHINNMVETIKFYKDKTKKFGLQSNCKDCIKQYKIKNKKAISQYTKQYGIENREAKKQYDKKNKQMTHHPHLHPLNTLDHLLHGTIACLYRSISLLKTLLHLPFTLLLPLLLLLLLLLRPRLRLHRRSSRQHWFRWW